MTRRIRTTIPVTARFVLLFGPLVIAVLMLHLAMAYRASAYYDYRTGMSVEIPAE